MEGIGRHQRRFYVLGAAIVKLSYLAPPDATFAASDWEGQTGYLIRLTRRFLWIICLPGLLFVGASAASADDTPRPTCAAIAPRLMEIYLARGVSALPLTERERINVSHYLSVRRRPDWTRIYLYRNRLAWEPEPNLSLIFPNRECGRSCIGTAVLPRGDQFDLIDFAYRKNLIAEPNFGEPKAIDGFQEKHSTSLIFMDVHERHFVAFFDFQRLPADLPWNRETLKEAQSVGSGTSMLAFQDRRPGYSACYKNLFAVEGTIP